MPRATTKQDLIQISESNFQKLWELIDSLSAEEFEAEFDFSSNPKLKEAHYKRDKNIRDVLVHLHEWHQLLITWIHTNKSGKQAHFLPTPYTWRTYGDLNIEFWKKHQKTSYEKAINLLKNSHKEAMGLIDTFSNKELFTNKYFSWTGSTSLGSYCVSSTSSHYDWAIKKIKKHKANICYSKKIMI